MDRRRGATPVGILAGVTSFEHSDSVVVETTPDALYALVSDVTRTGEWSPICQACWWNDDAEAGRVGATFTGRNVTPDRTWETVSTVTAAEPGREFGWVVAKKVVRWSYTLEPVGSTATRLTESWHFTPEGIEFFHDKYGDDAEREIAARRDAALDGIPRTLAAIKRIAEN